MNVMLTSKSQEIVRNQQTNYLLFFSLDGMFQDAAILPSLYEDLSRDLDAHCVCGESDKPCVSSPAYYHFLTSLFLLTVISLTCFL